MSEIPFDPDFAHMISEAIMRKDYDVARFLLACGSFGDSLNHAYKSEMEAQALEFLYGLDKSSELNVKAKLLQKYSEDIDGRFISVLTDNGIFPRFLEEAWKNYESARDSLNDLLEAQIPKDVVVDVSSFKLEEVLEGLPYF